MPDKFYVKRVSVDDDREGGRCIRCAQKFYLILKDCAKRGCGIEWF